MNPTTCPEPDTLGRLLLGQLSDQDSEVVTAHLEQCQGCLAAMREIGARDPLVSAVRGWAEGCPATVSQVSGQDTQISPPAVAPGLDPLAERLIEQLRRLPRRDAVRGGAEVGSVGHEPGPHRSDAGGEQAPAFPFLHPPQQADEIGRLGAYRILKVLGQGGMGVVFQAHDPKLKRLCAIKAMRPEVASRAGMKDRFLREAQAAAALESDYVVPIYQVDEDNGAPYIAMPFLKGMSLEDWLQTRQREKPDSKLKPQVILKLARDIARGLAEAHAAGLIHRDIKPANIWLDSKVSGRARILDFGLARLTEGTGDQHLTQSGMVLGTPAYMAPEQAEGEKLDGRADLFSLGVIVYRLCTGELPFKGNSTLATLAALVTRDPPPPAAVNPATPPALSDLVMWLLRKDREARIGSAKEVLTEVQRLERELAAGTTSESQFASESISEADAASVSSSPVVEAASVGKTGDASFSASTMLQVAGDITASQLGRLNRVFPPNRRWTAFAAAAAAIVLAGIVLYWATDKGTVRIEINAPGITAQFDDDGATLSQADRQPIKLSSGKHGLRIKYGALEFETDKFVLPRGETIDLKVELLPGKVQVVQGNKTIGERPWPPAVANVDVKGWPLDAPPPAIAPFDAAQAKTHQEAWAKYLGVPVEYINSIGMKFRLIPPGEFMMGSTPEEIEAALAVAGNNEHWKEHIRSETPQHKVILTQAIYLGVHEVTQAQYEQVMGQNPSHFAATGPGKDAVVGMDTTHHPVELVSWNDAAEFCAKLSEKEQLRPCYFRSGETVTMLDGNGYRLPTEAQWEFACRAGTTTKYWIGDQDESLGQAAWLGRNSGGRTHAVGELKANPLGLYDIHGSVWEWVQDWWEPTYYGQFQEKPALDPGGPSSAGSRRVLRGGYWGLNASFCRASSRGAVDPTYRYCNIGFRVALAVDAIRKPSATTASTPTAASAGWHGWPVDAPPPAIAPFDADQAKTHQEAWAKYLGVPVEYINSIGMKFRLIPPGEFLMGSTPQEVEATLAEVGDEEFWKKHIRSQAPQHPVLLTQPLYLGMHEVTQAQYELVMERNPAYFSASGGGKHLVAGVETSQHAVEMVSWSDAWDFCTRLSAKEKLNSPDSSIGDSGPAPAVACRLPTEAEWEFACRAGTTTKYSIGERNESLSQAGWFNLNASGRSHAVGQLRPNPFGLYDVHGNVWEWIQDWWDSDYYGKIADDVTVNPRGPAVPGHQRIVRGGGWLGRDFYCQSSGRGAAKPADAHSELGFRVALSVDAVKSAAMASPKLATVAPTSADRVAAEWALAAGATIAIQVGDSLQTITPPQPLPPGDFQLREIRRPTKVDWRKENLAVLAELRNLRVLDLFQCSPSAAAWRRIGAIGSLEELYAQRTNISDALLAEVTGLSRLKALVLADCNITDAGLTHLAMFTDLEFLGLGNTGIAGRGLTALRSLVKLRHLRVDNLVLDPGWSDVLEACPDLDIVACGGGPIATQDLRNIARLPRLTRLDVSYSAVNDQSIPVLASIKTLTHLHMWTCGVTESGVQDLRRQLGPSVNVDARNTVPDAVARALLEGTLTPIDLSDRCSPEGNALLVTNDALAAIRESASMLPERPGMLTDGTLVLDRAWARLPGTDARDCAIRLEILPVRSAELPTNAPAQAILCLRERAEGAYMFILHDNGHVVLGAYDTGKSGGYRQFGTLLGGATPPQDFVRATCAVVGDRLFFWVGDVYLTARDSTYTSGGAVLGWLGGNAAFRNVEYQILDEPK
jgi:formylglycine-generating enzyme required for sulfatase activity/serine/threonine protein kinase